MKARIAILAFALLAAFMAAPQLVGRAIALGASFGLSGLLGLYVLADNILS